MAENGGEQSDLTTSNDLSQIRICTQLFPDGIKPEDIPLSNVAGRTPDGGFTSALPDEKLWPNGKQLKVRFLPGATPFVQSKVKQYAVTWLEYANIGIHFVDAAPADIRISFDIGSGSWSYVGLDNLKFKEPQPTMNFGWFDDQTPDNKFSRVVIHEFGHALGCVHEHLSPMETISWNFEAVYAYYAQTQHWDRQTTYNNMFNVRKSAELDKAFIAEIYPSAGINDGFFSTGAVASTVQVNELRYMKNIELTTPLTPWPPSITAMYVFALGLKSLDIGNAPRMLANSNIEFVDSTNLLVSLSTWKEQPTFAADLTWFGLTQSVAGYEVGAVAFGGHPETVFFRTGFAEPPALIFWINQIDLIPGASWKFRPLVSNATTNGFQMDFDYLNTFGHGISWIAISKDKTKVASGIVDTLVLHPEAEPQLANSGQVDFSAFIFNRPPLVLMALTSFNMDGGHNLRIKTYADSVTKDGMTWHIDTWDDSVLYIATASWIAIG